MDFFKKILLLGVILSSFLTTVFAQATSIPGLYRYKLENGLELFVVENDSAPLAYIEIAVRCGALTQTPETAGLFHLYEHMMFKGNEKYANEAQTMAAMNSFGVENSNGTTGVDRVNYYFTIPANLVREGLEFWSYAVRTPKFDEDELAKEKGVVLSEIKGNYNQPNRIAANALNRHLYPDFPYRLDPSGQTDTISGCTVEALRRIQKEFYVPDNAAVFVGGDVDHEQIYKMVSEIYGGWKKSGRDFRLKNLHSKVPASTDIKLVYPNPTMSPSMMTASLNLRGPDGENEPEDTYAADVWSFLLADPSGVFVQTLLKDKSLSIPDADYAGGYYLTQRQSGHIGMNAVMMMNEISPVEKAEKFRALVKKDCAELFADENSSFSDNMSLIVNRLEDSNIYHNETAEGLLGNLSYMWACCGFDYYQDYDSNIGKVTKKQVADFAKKYIKDKSGVFFVNINPDVYNKYKKEFEEAGYVQVSAENAFWWNDK